MNSLAIPMVAGLGTTELLIILGVLILLFGAKKLPELARGSGRALRIFKSETKGLRDDDETKKKPTEPAGELNPADDVRTDDVAEGEIVDEHRERNA